MSAQTTDRPRKSIKLSKEELASFVKWVKDQPTKVDAAINLGVARFTIERILSHKSAHPDTYEKIKKVITKEIGADMIVEEKEAAKA